MKKLWIASALLLLPCVGIAQQTMPRMDMSQREQMKQSASTQDKSETMQMPMDMNTAAQQDDPMKAKPSGDRPSTTLQPTQQGVEKPGKQSDASSVRRDTMTLQEPENEGFHTGQDLPAPELLKEVTARAAMSVGDFESIAEKSDPTVAQARAYVRQSEEQGRQAGLLPNPTVGYSGDQIRGGTFGGGEQGAYIQQEFVLGGKLGMRRDIYRQEAKRNQIGVEEQTFRVRNSVQQAFYRALTDQELVVVRQRLLKVSLDAVETAHQLENLGQADAPDVLQTEVEAEHAKIDFAHAQREYLQAFNTLAAIAGAQELAVTPLKGNLEQPPELNAEDQAASIIANGPSVRRAQQQVTIEEAKIKDAQRESIPNLTVRAGERYSGEVIEGSHKAAGPQSFVEAGVNLPLWNRNQGNIGAAKARLEHAMQEVTRTRLDLKRRTEPLVQEYLASHFEAERYRTQLLPRARRAYELYLTKYQQMAAAYSEVLISQRSLFELQVDYLRALDSEWRTALALQNDTLTAGPDQSMSTGQDTTMINLPTGGGSQ